MTRRCGVVAIVGKPNVGKSTLLNVLVGAKVSITSSKPQTTRHVIRGIRTDRDTQFVFVDTPGYQTRHGGALNRALNQAIKRALADVDVAVHVFAAGEITDEDRSIARSLVHARNVIIGVNKSDRMADPARMLPFLQQLAQAFPDREIVPFSAKTGTNVDELLRVIQRMLPEQSFIYDEDSMTDRDERFLAAEMIREKLFRSLHEEIPYGAVVTIDLFKQDGALRRIAATILVDKAGHKSMIIGAKGERLKGIASAARRDMEKLFGGKVFLEVWVKPRPGWSDSAAELRRLGFE